MNFVCDEGVDASIVLGLRQLGHAVVWIAEHCPAASDDVVLAAAVDQSSVVVTADKDFGELVYRRGSQHCGVLLLRLHGLSAERKAAVVLAALAAADPWPEGCFAVVTSSKLRIRSVH